MTLVIFARWLAARRTVSNDTSGTRVATKLRGGRGALMSLGTATLVLLANMPLIVVVGSSFLEVRGVVFQPALTLANYTNAFAALGDALWNSLRYAAIALVMILVLGSLAGYLIARRSGLLSRLADLLIMVPYVVPGTVLGIGYASVFNQPPLMLTGTASIIVVMYVIRRLPFVARASASISTPQRLS